MKNNNVEYFQPDGSDLASRVAARHLRIDAERAIALGKIAAVDLTNVISISESYADELFAVLVEQHGLEWFSKNIKLLHQEPSSNFVLLSIATAIRRRLEDQDSSTIKSSVDQLIAAKKLVNSKSNDYQHA